MISRDTVGKMLAFLVLLPAALHASPASAGPAEVLENIEAAPSDWLPDLGSCPADVMPKQEAASVYFEERCAARLERCLNNCRAGDASDCYASALILQRVRNSPISEALFLKACALGIVSGCTNRAAGMEAPGAQPGSGNECSVRTFNLACERNDPWACTMAGFHLARGIGVAKDPARARQVLAKSCKYGEQDQACAYAKGILKEIPE
jgi:TPR repeat protein